MITSPDSLSKGKLVHWLLVRLSISPVFLGCTCTGMKGAEAGHGSVSTGEPWNGRWGAQDGHEASSCQAVPYKSAMQTWSPWWKLWIEYGPRPKTRFPEDFKLRRFNMVHILKTCVSYCDIHTMCSKTGDISRNKTENVALLYVIFWHAEISNKNVIIK